MCPQVHPSQEDLDRLMRRLRPRIAGLLVSRNVSPEEAERLVGEALIEIAYRWSRVHDHAGWLLKSLDKKTRPWLKITKEEPVP